MTDPCWMMAQLLVDCDQSDRSLKMKPLLPSSTEVELQAESRPQPRRVVAWSTSTPTRPTMAAATTVKFDAPPSLFHLLEESGLSSALQRRISADSRPQMLESPLAQFSQNLNPASQSPQASSPTPQNNSQVAILPQFDRDRLEAVLTAAAPQLPGPRPSNGSQLFQQRWAALQAGQLYTRIASNSFAQRWQTASTQPSHQQWQALLAREAKAVEAGQGSNRLTVLVGDSLSMWLPPDLLPRDRFWLNQGISGDTTAGILQRLHFFADTRPTTIHLMAGINDLKNGASDADVINNLREIMVRLQQQHPQAQIVVHSILPTRWPQLPSGRIRRINGYVQFLAQQQGVEFLDLQSTFADAEGNLRLELTSDGLHLSPQGYQLWQLALQQI